MALDNIRGATSEEARGTLANLSKIDAGMRETFLRDAGVVGRLLNNGLGPQTLNLIKEYPSVKQAGIFVNVGKLFLTGLLADPFAAAVKRLEEPDRNKVLKVPGLTEQLRVLQVDLRGLLPAPSVAK